MIKMTYKSILEHRFRNSSNPKTERRAYENLRSTNQMPVQAI